MRADVFQHFRLYPTAGQRQALARAFGCARTVFNDELRARREAREQGRRTSRTLSCPGGSSRRRSRPRSGPGFPGCRRWCCSRRWPI
ncbi:helix-turn-helix domain-containing protein [Nonomuraea mesophila]|uniref:helix-turn-helix domain-containing protein n=1 Tax=Nonomuraea mesophila TaxID=2530382 RepID=UPI003CCC7DEA